MFNRLILKIAETLFSKKEFSNVFWYQYLSKIIKDPQWVFINYGFQPTDQKPTIALSPEDEPNRLHIQLYHHLLKEVDLLNKNLLEIGSGRGGGAAAMAKYYPVKTVTALDKSSGNIKISKKLHPNKKINFIKGNAEKLAFPDNFFDVIVNIESSHCYGQINRFLSEVHRVLKPSGDFLLADFRPIFQLPNLTAELEKSKLKIIKQQDITKEVFLSLQQSSTAKVKLIKEIVPKNLQKDFFRFAGVAGTPNFESFAKGQLVYQLWILKKVSNLADI